MKKVAYLSAIFTLSLIMLSTPQAKADTQLYGFMDGKFYTQDASFVCQRLGDGHCYDLDGIEVSAGYADPSQNLVVNPAPVSPTQPVQPTPVIQSPNQQVPSVNPAYTEAQLTVKLHCADPLLFRLDSPSIATFSLCAMGQTQGTNYNTANQYLSVYFNGQLVFANNQPLIEVGGHVWGVEFGGLTSGDYPYQFVYQEPGRDSTTISKILHVP